MNSLKVGFIGLGNMGMPMAKSLLRGGFPLVVYDLRQAPVEEMKALGAVAAGSSRQIAENSDVVISMVLDIPQTEAAIFGPDGVWQGISKGKTIIISSSIGPEYCRKLYALAREREVGVIDCCVTGRDPSCENRPMTLIIGGDEDNVKHFQPLFEALGSNQYYVGGIGTGQAYKLIHNIIAKHITAASRDCLIEGLNLGLKAGLDLPKMIDVLSAGVAARNLQSIGLKSGLDSKNIFEIIRDPLVGPRFAGTHMNSELEYGMQMADSVGAKMPVGKMIEELDMESTYEAFYALKKQTLSK
jgi:2-hydroxy-3-oxopropionate reductase